MPDARPGILTLTTDFGTRDAYVAAMKGVVLGLFPSVRLVDVSHEIVAHDVMEAAFVLRDAALYFPPGTVHLVVVDPEVGTARRPVAARWNDQFFVGPDNGLLPLVFRDEADEVVVLDRPELWRGGDTSATFHGRDIFAPVAARLAAGSKLSDVGSRASELKRMHWPLPIHDDQGVRGWIVHIDAFGNGITNIPRDAFESGRSGRPFKCYVGNAILDQIQTTYASVAAGEPVLLFNSSDLLEIALFRGNAAEMMDLRPGGPVNVVFLDERA